MALSIHDNILISYTVSEQEKTVLLETYYDADQPFEYTNVLFTDVLAYFFENHSLYHGTIIYGVEEDNAESVLESNWQRFEDGKKWGWPGPWADTKEKAQSYFKDHSIKAYYLSSSLGMCGWILAKKMEIFSK